MLSGTALSILLIAMTPLLGGMFALLLLFQAIRGWLEGVIQPLVLSVQARAVGRHQQGAVVGLRQTGQRLTSIMIPPLMGGIADRWGVSESFFILGALIPSSGRSAAASSAQVAGLQSARSPAVGTERPLVPPSAGRSVR